MASSTSRRAKKPLKTNSDAFIPPGKAAEVDELEALKVTGHGEAGHQGKAPPTKV